MTQVTDTKGKLLTIGHVYEFNDEGGGEAPWRVHTLRSVDICATHQYRVGINGSIGYSRIREMQATIGKVVNPPVELVEGEVYSFFINHWGVHTRAIGFYNKNQDAFYMNSSLKDSHVQDANTVTDIVLLKPVP